MRRRRIIDVLWGSRRHPKPNPRVQENLAAWTLHPARNVQAAPIAPPIRKDEPRA